MNKTELINAISEKAGLSKVDSKKALDAFIETVGEELKKGEKSLLLVSEHILLQKKLQEKVSILELKQQSTSLLKKL